MGGAAFDPLTPTLIKILNLKNVNQKDPKKLGVLAAFSLFGLSLQPTG